jgi:acyl carrier protein
VADSAEIHEAIRDILLSSWPHRFVPEQLSDETSLGQDGLGLDSIEIVEVLLACEERCGTGLTDALFATPPLTIRHVAEHLAIP